MQTPPEKSDAREIESFLEDLASEPWVKRTHRSWWPKFVFHYTDIRNAIKILQDDKLLCRATRDSKEKIQVDSASPDIIECTKDEYKECVRLYFRPRTPTQYRNEGIRPINCRQLGAHCPVPAFFLFDAAKILARSDCRFSNGNLASPGARVGDSANFLRSLPFDRIYHDTYYDREPDQDIKFHRNAEVIIPQELGLSDLKYIICRSPAEKESLLYLLPNRLRQRWQKGIFSEGKFNLFLRRWTFVEKAVLSGTWVIFHFSRDTSTPGPFEARTDITDMDSGKKDRETETNFLANKTWGIKIPDEISSYEVRLELGDALAYVNRYTDDDLPF